MTTKYHPFSGGRGPIWPTHHLAAGWSSREMVPDLGLSVGLWHSAELVAAVARSAFVRKVHVVEPTHDFRLYHHGRSVRGRVKQREMAKEKERLRTHSTVILSA